MTDTIAGADRPSDQDLHEISRLVAGVLDALDVMRDKWVPPVFSQLSTGTRSYGELLSHLPAIQQSMLSRTLRGMERNGLVKRDVLSTAPPQTRYSLTDLGRSLEPVLVGLAGWSESHRADLYAARVRYESAAILRRAYP